MTAALAACAGAPVVRRASPAPPVARAAPAPPAWEAVLLPSVPNRAGIERAGTESDGAVDAVVGSVRLRVRGESVEWSRDLTLAPLVAYARDGDRWFFASADGAAFRAESFTGELSRVGDTAGRPVHLGFDSASVLAVAVDDRALWLAGPDGAFGPAPAPADGALVDAGFVDRLFGVAVVSPGRLLRTVDGGAHFDPVDLGPHAVAVVYPNPDGFVLETTGGLYRVGPAGAPTPWTGPSGGFEHAVPPEVLAAVRASVFGDATMGYAFLLAADRVVLADGRAADTLGDELVVRGPQGGTTRVPLPQPGCTPFAWGARVLLSCDARDEGAVLYATDGQRPFTEVHRLPAPATLLPGVDGEALVALGGCDEGPRSRDEERLCWFDGTRWQDRALEGRPRVLGAYGDALLFARPGRGTEGARSAEGPVFLARSGEPGERPLELDGAAGAELLSARFAGDGSVAGVALRGPERLVALGAPERPLALHPLPAGALRVAFADARHGVAAGEDLAHVWVTSDGARSWSPLEVPVEGDASGVSVERQRATIEGPLDPVVCSAQLCRVGDRLLWAPPGPVVASLRGAIRTLGAAHAPRVAPDAPRAPLALARAVGWLGAWQCARASQNAPAPVPPVAERTYGGDGWLEPHAAGADPALAGRFAFAWGGQDERGRFRASALPTVLAPVELPPGVVPDSAAAIPRVLTRSLAVLERCVHADFTDHCDLVVAPRGAHARVLGAPSSLLALSTHHPALSGALPLPDGGALLHLAPAGDPPVPPRVDLLVRLSPRGDVVAQRGFAWPHGALSRMPALGPDGPGLFVTSEDDPHASTFYTLDPADDGRPLPARAPGALSACASSAPDPRAVSVLATAPGYGPAVLFGGRFLHSARDEAQPLVEFTPQGEACLRGFTLWPQNPNDPQERQLLDELGGLPRLRAASGGITGTVMDPHVEGAVVCQWRR